MPLPHCFEQPRKASAPAILVLPLLCACCPDSGTNDEATVTKLTQASVEVGSKMGISGRGFVAKSEGWVDVTLLGTFTRQGANEGQSVHLTVPLRSDGSDTLSWERFGAYRVPFGGGEQIGTFTGKVIATNRYFDETAKPALSSSDLEATLTVEPSVVLIEARAIGPNWIAACKDPPTTVMHGVTYLFRFRAVGFEAKQFDYTLGEGFVVGGATTTEATHYSVPMLESEHAVLLELGSVPAAANGFRTSISVDAAGTDGSQHRLELPIVVRRPLQVYFPAPMQIARIYPAEPVSGCIPGGKTGLDVTYSESHSESRARAVTWSETSGWTESYGKQFAETYSTSTTTGTSTATSQSTTVTDGRSRAWGDSWHQSAVRTECQRATAQIRFSKTDKDRYTWTVGDDVSTGVNAEIGGAAASKTKVDLGVASEAIEVGVQAKVAAFFGTKPTLGKSGAVASAESYPGGLSQTDGASLREGLARSLGAPWGLSQSYSEANSYSTQQSVTTTAGYSEAVTDSQTLGITGSNTISDVVSTTDANLTDTTAKIPANQQGVWYRQATRRVQRGVVVAYDLCGNGEAVGRVTLDDWTWTPTLAIGGTCPPPGDLAAPQCFVEPCDH